MGTNDFELRSLEVKIESLQKYALFLKDELWHLEIDLIALKDVLQNLKRKEK